MPAERAGYTVTMFLVDTSPSMGTIRSIELPPGPNGEKRFTKITHLDWVLRYVKLKIQEMIFNGRKTDQCGVIVFGSEVTDNVINEKNGGYDNVQEYIPIGQPNIGTLAKLDALRPSTVYGDPVDALIVAIETQAQYLAKKKTWTRKILLVTDGEGPIEVEDWEATVEKMNDLDIRMTIVGADFDDVENGYQEPNKTIHKRTNETFYQDLTKAMKEGHGVLGTCDYALQEVARPECKSVRSALMGTILRLGDVDDPEEAVEIIVKASKCTALTRPASLKKFALREEEDEMEVDDGEDKTAVYTQLKMRTEYYIDRNAGNDDEEEDVKMEEDDDTLLLEGDEGKKPTKEENLERVEKEELIRGFKYGTTYAPCPDGQFPRLQTSKGIDICGFFPEANFRRELSMGEVQYIWGDPSSPQQQVALSSIVKAMEKGKKMAIARWVSRDGMDPKMGVLVPGKLEGVDCLLWAHMPFADDVRRYTFASLDNLVSKKGEQITEHPFLPTEAQQDAMDDFVDAMDLMDAGDEDENGNPTQWFSTIWSYNPAIHRVKQAIFHSAVVSDIATNPLPPPHPELTAYFEPPEKALKRARKALKQCTKELNVKEVPKRVAKARKDGHAYAPEEDDSLLLLDRKGATPSLSGSTIIPPSQVASSSRGPVKVEPTGNDSDTEEDEDEDLLLNQAVPRKGTPPKGRAAAPLPTPARSVSPRGRGNVKDDDSGVDPGRAPGRIIGTTYPLKDFRKNIARGDVVTKAVEDLAVVVTEIVMKPFTSRRTDELVECMKVMRQTCLEEDEIDAWNAFLKDLKGKCLSKPGNPVFWGKVKDLGRSFSLISDKEAKEQGGVSKFTEKQADEFIA